MMPSTKSGLLCLLLTAIGTSSATLGQCRITLFTVYITRCRRQAVQRMPTSCYARTDGRTTRKRNVKDYETRKNVCVRQYYCVCHKLLGRLHRNGRTEQASTVVFSIEGSFLGIYTVSDTRTSLGTDFVDSVQLPLFLSKLIPVFVFQFHIKKIFLYFLVPCAGVIKLAVGFCQLLSAR